MTLQMKMILAKKMKWEESEEDTFDDTIDANDIIDEYNTNDEENIDADNSPHLFHLESRPCGRLLVSSVGWPPPLRGEEGSFAVHVCKTVWRFLC